MATTNHDLEYSFIRNYPHTSNSMTKLLTAMADAYNNKGKQSFFGHDKGLKSYEKFEKRLKELIKSMILDELIPLSISKNDCRKACIDTINLAIKIWPNWNDAYSFADEYFVQNKKDANFRIKQFLRDV